MAPKVIADTNVFYHIAEKKFVRSDLVQPGQELWATPINVMEICSRLLETGVDWRERRNALRSLLRSADGVAPDPESLIAYYAGNSPANNDLWWNITQIISRAWFKCELSTGVYFLPEWKKKSVKISAISGARDHHYQDFESKVASMIDLDVPGYQASITAKTPAPKLHKSQVTGYRKMLSSIQFRQAMATALLYRTTAKPPATFNPVQFHADLDPYATIYGRYIDFLATRGYKPDINDWGDLELFIYASPRTNTIVATGERKWIDLSVAAGLSAQVIDTRSLCP